jgi:FkbM family methyltransferase
MKKLKSILKSLLGDVNVHRLRELKNKISPNEFYKREQEDLARRKEFYGQFVHANDLCFDVGANLGNRVGPLLDIRARVIAIEPQERCRKILHARFGKKIVIVPYGLGAKEEIAEFHISDASYLSSFSRDWIDSVKKDRFKENNWDTVEKVQMTTLDKLIANHGVPAFIKIDVEGYELEVLSGLSMPIGMISFEYTTPEQTENALNCLKRLKAINPDIECNFSVGENMRFEWPEFRGIDEMLRFTGSDDFVNTGFGDIYVRSKNSGAKHP